MYGSALCRPRLQTTEAFFESIAHVKPLCVGLNCALGATQVHYCCTVATSSGSMQLGSAIARVREADGCGIDRQMRPFLERLSQTADCFVHAYPNAGLPNAMGGYDDTPEQARPKRLAEHTFAMQNMERAFHGMQHHSTAQHALRCATCRVRT